MKNLLLIIKTFLVSIIFLLSKSSRSQITDTKSAIGISIPVILNNSEATYYQLGSPKYPQGKAISYGINVNYSFFFYKGIYAKIGAGYFRQTFGISRPFYYASRIQFGWETDSYTYNNVQVYGGIGYKKAISKTILLNGSISYNQYYSFRQKYINASPVPSQVNHKFITIGRMIGLGIGVEKKVSNKISTAMRIIFPFSIRWNNDEIFAYYGYSDNTQQIARNRLSLGAAFSCYYNF